MREHKNSTTGTFFFVVILSTIRLDTYTCTWLFIATLIIQKQKAKNYLQIHQYNSGQIN